MGRSRAVRIGYAAVDGGSNYRLEARRNRDALHEALAGTVAASTRDRLDLLVFPAGFFQARDASEQARVLAKVEMDLDALSPTFGIAFGIDCHGGTKSAKGGKAAELVKTSKKAAPSHPFFAYYRSPAGTITKMQQVSVTADEGASDVVASRWHDRSEVLPGTDIAFLICGESWSDALLERVASRRPRALVVAAHRNVNMHREATGYGKLSWHRRLAAFQREHRIPVVLSEHTRSPHRHPYSWPSRISTPLPPVELPVAVTRRVAVV